MQDQHRPIGGGPGRGDVHVWHVPDVRHDLWEASYDDLSPLEVERAERFVFPVHRSRYIRSRSILRSVLAVYQPGEPPLEYATGTFGKPYVDGSLCQFNISHSSDSLAIAVSLSQVGVDIERKRYVNPHQLARACMSESERADLSLMSEPAALEYFFRVWTAKEALLKAAGLGLRIDPKQISLTISKEIRIDALPARLGSVSDWSISTLGLAGNMAAALATAGSPSNIRILHCSVDAGAVDVLPMERTMGAVSVKSDLASDQL